MVAVSRPTSRRTYVRSCPRAERALAIGVVVTRRVVVSDPDVEERGLSEVSVAIVASPPLQVRTQLPGRARVVLMEKGRVWSEGGGWLPCHCGPTPQASESWDGN